MSPNDAEAGIHTMVLLQTTCLKMKSDTIKIVLGRKASKTIRDRTWAESVDFIIIEPLSDWLLNSCVSTVFAHVCGRRAHKFQRSAQFAQRPATSYQKQVGSVRRHDCLP